ncbi:sensor histidine kinase [uncultured Kriegella sp.]|uniref:sensor histidine kinase n=1 Tax=uncultured Kriegella sp. TaxID=1798910 RepID=UPI0030DA8093|tara:strand:- start:66930 stop:68141 length:1212 start_codon:yes stop_codon:yes gene_type:complete
MKILTKITNLGVSNQLDENTTRRVRIVNQISIFLFVLFVLQSTVALSLGFPKITVILFAAVSLVSIVPPLLNKLEMTIASRVFSISSAYLVLLCQVLVFGPELHIQFFFMSTVAGPLLLFDKEIGIWKWALVAVPALIWIYLEWHFANIPPMVHIAPNAIFWARITNNLLLFSIIFILFFTFTRQSNNHIEDIEQHRMSIETLLKEIHHRVKNNLQVITSLLALQSVGIEEQKIKNLFKELQNRINSMALSHEMLYKTDDLERIDYEAYIRKLITGLISTMKEPENEIEIHLSIKQVYLNIDTAIPLGLIINEIVTNSLKYAFKNNSGTISICLRKLNHPNFLLEIGDNGIGFPTSVLKAKRRSLGLTLIQKLTRQLRGNIVRDTLKEGSNYIIHFQEITPKS